MSNEKLFDYNPDTGIKTFFSSSGKHMDDWTFRYEFDNVDAELEGSRGLQKTNDHWNDGVKDGMLHYAHIPDSLLLKFHIEGVNINNNAELFAKVNSRDYSYLKCVGKIHVVK
jgi:hypothetical protein